MKKILFFILITTTNTAISYETAKYDVIKVFSGEDKIEIRQYKNLILAKTSTKTESENSNFKNLFKFISGDNKQNQKIKMTTPVFQESNKNQESMFFVMPNKFTKDNLPKPKNKNIQFEFLQNVKFIAIEFSGRAIDKNFKEHQKILEKVIKENNIKVDLSNPINAYYNSPLTLPFLKRNEVLFKLN